MAAALCGMALVANAASMEPTEPKSLPVYARYGSVDVTVYRPAGRTGQLVGVASDRKAALVMVAAAEGSEIALTTVAGTVQIQRVSNGFAITVSKPDGSQIRSSAVTHGNGYRISNVEALDSALRDVLAPANAVVETLTASARHYTSQLPGPSGGFEVQAQEITTCEVAAVLTTTLEATAMAAAFPTMGGSLLAGALTSVFFGMLWALAC